MLAREFQLATQVRRATAPSWQDNTFAGLGTLVRRVGLVRALEWVERKERSGRRESNGGLALALVKAIVPGSHKSVASATQWLETAPRHQLLATIRRSASLMDALVLVHRVERHVPPGGAASQALAIDGEVPAASEPPSSGSEVSAASERDALPRVAGTTLARDANGLARFQSQSLDHVGLAVERFVPFPLEGGPHDKDSKEARSAFIRDLADHAPVPEGYGDAYARWCRRTPTIVGERMGRVVLQVRAVGRVLVGLGLQTPLENGLALDTWGVPYLPGSGLKGALRSWCVETQERGTPWAPGGDAFAAVFGWADSALQDDVRRASIPDDEEWDSVHGEAGLVAFLDAKWIPGTASSPWAAEIVTPHVGGYYNRGGDPDGLASPVPNTFLAAEGAFRIVLEGPTDWIEATAVLLLEVLRSRGVGAKTRAGYGRFETHDVATRAFGSRPDWEAARQARRVAMEAAEVERETLASGSAQERLDLLSRGVTDAAVFRDGVLRWLAGITSDPVDVRLRAFEWDVEHTKAFGRWAARANAAVGVVKVIADEAHAAAFASGAGLQDAGVSAGGWGTNHLGSEHFPDASKMPKRNGFNKFARRIADGRYDERTVRAALEHLRGAGAKPGHLKLLFEAYPELGE